MLNIVFFSRYKRDAYSPRLLAYMNSMPFRKEFKYYCIDPDPTTRKRNDELLELLEVTEVPTLYVSGNKFVGEEAFLWLQEQADQLQGGGPPPQYNDYPQQGGADYRYHQGGDMGMMRGQEQFQPQMGPQMASRLPGVGGGLPSVGGFAGMATGGRMPNGMGMIPSQEQLEPLSGGAGDSPFANPFAADALSTGRINAERFLTPENTKGVDGDRSSRMDEELKRLSMEREALAPQGGGGGGLPGFGGRGMQELQMPMRR